MYTCLVFDYSHVGFFTFFRGRAIKQEQSGTLEQTGVTRVVREQRHHEHSDQSLQQPEPRRRV